MHLNFHFLKYLCPELEEKFKGKSIQSCFSQSKDELIIETSDSQESRWIRAHLLAPQVYVGFPSQFHRAKRNTINLFPDLLGEVIRACKVFAFERAFYFEFESGKRLVFKLHGNRSNILLYNSGESKPHSIFRNEVKDDRELDFSSIANPLDLSKERFEELEGNASKFLPTLGTIPRNWLKERGYPEAEISVKWNLIQDLMDMLDTPLFSLVQDSQEVHLSLLPADHSIKTFSDPVEAVNELFYLALVKGSFEKEKNTLLKNLNDQLKRTENYLEKSGEKLSQLQNSPPPSQLADVIMANLHEFSGGKNEAILLDFYTGKEILISLKPQQKPQDLAQNLYRKSKNRQIELDQLAQTLKAKEEQKVKILAQLAEIQGIQEYKSLKNYQKTHFKTEASNSQSTGFPFKIFEFEGFTIWVGKSAKDNDEMLRGYCHKDDIWLHARQAAGSHVIIRTKGMPKVPNSVLERAASLAAFYSKMKSDSLAPVIYTEAKYVRKVKGSAPGSVMVDREKVLLIPPKGPSSELAV